MLTQATVSVGGTWQAWLFFAAIIVIGLFISHAEAVIDKKSARHTDSFQYFGAFIAAGAVCVGVLIFALALHP